jgi:prevent-host-death family protein
MKSLKASEFKARCLAVLDEVERTGEPVSISKRGRIVARLVPPRSLKETRYPQRALKGTGKTLADIIIPAVSVEAWDALGGTHR